MMKYSELKMLLRGMAPHAFKGLVNTDSGSITELALYARMTNAEISGSAHKFGWALRETTITLTGADSYNLNTLIPDLDLIYQVGNNQFNGRDAKFQTLREFNIQVPGGPAITISGNLLKIRGVTTGQLTIPYFSNYLVLDADGVTRKLDFENDNDTSIIPNSYVPMLPEGIMRFVYRKTEKTQYTKPMALLKGRIANVDPFLYLVQQAILADRPVHQTVYDFRYRG